MIFAILVLLVTILLFIDYYVKHFSKWKHYYRIPGPKGVPLLGNIDAFLYQKDELFDIAKKHALMYFPIYKFDPLNTRFVALLHPDDIELVLSDMKHNTKSFVYDFLHEWLGTGLLTSTGSKWQKRRKILTPAFHFSILQDFIEIFNAETKKLVEDIKKISHQPSVDVIPLITQFTLDAINETAMGSQLDVNHDEKVTYQTTIHKMSHIISQRLTKPAYFSKLLYKFTSLKKHEDKTRTILQNFTRKVIQDRERKFVNQSQKEPEALSNYSSRKKLAMLDLLIRAKNEGEDIDIQGIQEEVDTFMFEGHDTTATAMCYILMLLANHPAVQEEALQEIKAILGDNTNPSYQELQDLKYTERVIKESLRLFPSVPIISRTAAEDIVTKTGYRIPKGTTVNIGIFNMHRSPHFYDDPDKFDVDRFLPENIQNRHPFAYIPFSAGPRNCIGQKFAMLEMKAALCGILRNFKLEPIDAPEDMKMAFDIILRSLKSIRVKFVPRE